MLIQSVQAGSVAVLTMVGVILMRSSDLFWLVGFHSFFLQKTTVVNSSVLVHSKSFNSLSGLPWNSVEYYILWSFFPCAVAWCLPVKLAVLFKKLHFCAGWNNYKTLFAFLIFWKQNKIYQDLQMKGSRKVEILSKNNTWKLQLNFP